MDKSRRNFILGISSTYVALNVSLATGRGLNIINAEKNITIKDSHKNFYPDSLNNLSYDMFSVASVGAIFSSMILSNLDLLYSLVIIFVTVFLLLTIGIPGYEMLLPYSEQYFATKI